MWIIISREDSDLQYFNLKDNSYFSLSMFNFLRFKITDTENFTFFNNIKARGNILQTQIMKTSFGWQRITVLYKDLFMKCPLKSKKGSSKTLDACYIRGEISLIKEIDKTAKWRNKAQSLTGVGTFF